MRAVNMLRLLVRAAIGAVVLTLCAGALLLWALQAPEPLRAPDRGVELASVTLVEPGGERRAASRVRIEGDRISEIGPATTGAAGPFADAFALPALTDMHIHFPVTGFPGDEEYTALLLLAHGVATVVRPHLGRTRARDSGLPDGIDTRAGPCARRRSGG